MGRPFPSSGARERFPPRPGQNNVRFDRPASSPAVWNLGILEFKYRLGKSYLTEKVRGRVSLLFK